MEHQVAPTAITEEMLGERPELGFLQPYVVKVTMIVLTSRWEHELVAANRLNHLSLVVPNRKAPANLKDLTVSGNANKGNVCLQGKLQVLRNGRSI